MWCGIKVSASYLWAPSAIFVIKPKHDWQSRKNTVTQQNICYNKYWENCNVIISLFILSPDQDCLGKNCLPSRDVPTTIEQESYLQCFPQFFKHLLLFLHLCLSFYLPFQEQTIPGVMVFVQTPAYFCFASGGVRSHERERQREVKLPDRAEASSSDCRPSSICCPSVDVRTLPHFALLPPISLFVDPGL